MGRVLICPRNDEESLLILKIAKAFQIPIVISQQGHGATLDKEPDLIDRIRSANESAKKLVIVEIPGVETEKKLKDQGFEITIIDHHQYNDLDRLNDKSSLEQFLDIFRISDSDLQDHDFDPILVKGVAAIDRGFLWELQNIDLSQADQDRVIQYVKDLIKELGYKQRQEEEEQAKAAWEAREDRDGTLIIKSDQDDIDIRDAISYFIFEEYEKPTPTIIVQGEKKMYVQEVENTRELIEKYNGFLFGGARCWGMTSPRDGDLPEIGEVVEIIERG